MKDNDAGIPGPVRKRDETLGAESLREANGKTNGHSNGRAHAKGHVAAAPLDFWVVLEILRRRWGWLVLGALLFAGGFFYLASYLIKPKYTAVAQMLRYETPGDFFKTAPMSPETFSDIIRSPDLLARVGEQAHPPIPPEKLVKYIKIDPEPDSDAIKVSLAASDPQEAVSLLNNYMRGAEEFAKEWQRDSAAKLAHEYLPQLVTNMDRDIAVLQDRFRGLGPQVTNKLSEISGNLSALGTNFAASRPPSMLVAKRMEKLQTAMAELDQLLEKYTDKNPIVQGKQEYITDLRNQIAATSTNGAPLTSEAMLQQIAPQTIVATRPSGNSFDPEVEMVRLKLTHLEDGYMQLVKRQREAEMYANNPPGMVRVLAPAVLKTVQTNKRWLKVSMVSVFGGLLGIVASLGLILLVELKDNRLRSVDDLERVTQLPILTTLGDLQGMEGPERNQWAFRTWTMLQGKLSPSANHGLVCGVTSSTTGEGRSTWISLLAEAASLTGFRVLTIATKASPTHVQTPAEPTDEAASGHATADKAPAEGVSAEQVMPDPTAFGEAHAEEREMKPARATQNSNTNGSALAGNVLTSPSTVTEQLTGPNSQPVVHIPLPGWVWNLERRKQWGEALSHWRTIDNLVILVELPPADVPEAVLLGSNLPNLVWLADSGTADAGETRAQLETLRHARCNLVGAVLNREPSVPLKKRFPRWLGCVVAGVVLGLGSAQAQDDTKVNTRPTTETPSTSAVPDATTAPAETPKNVSFSIVHPAQRAAWQQHLTVGPGDVLNLGLYGQPEFTLTEVSIPSDGRLTYLEAGDVLATGLTIDELRAKFDEELAKFRRAPHTIITPVEFRSKRYYMLGKVMTKGVYVLDRPITVLEAIARAHGLENGLVDRNVIDLADFQRSFLVRGGKRFPLNFEKLFQDGDLAQNIPIEPGDYIYFPSTVVNEVYVVGEVRLPGTVSYHSSTTIMAAISARGGYTDRAYKARVLVVRGSINHPETFAVDTHAILDARAPDFKLQPKDIIYVNSRPFIRVEELADLATTAFIQSLITSWVGVDIVKPINQ